MLDLIQERKEETEMMEKILVKLDDLIASDLSQQIPSYNKDPRRDSTGNIIKASGSII